jgi:hypothetical protein
MKFGNHPFSCLFLSKIYITFCSKLGSRLV